MLIKDPQVRSLTQINIEDMLTSLGLENLRAGRNLVEFLCTYPARRFAHQVIDYDSQVGEAGLQAAGRQMIDRMAGGLEICGQENIPASGPLLFASNHPGMTDTMALFASIPRPDLRVVAARRPFLEALPHTSRHLIFVDEVASQRMSVVRLTTQHLRAGGAVLTFPAGQIEPDPACMPGASASLQQWSTSLAVFARLVPGLVIVPVIVSGVIWPAALHHPLTHLRRQAQDRERLAATLQIAAQTLLGNRPIAVRVSFGPALQAAQLPEDSAGLVQAVTFQAQHLIEHSASPTIERRLGRQVAGQAAGLSAAPQQGEA